jgi:ABC-type nickel/cobalt efflux system permease component RcnA
MVSGAVAPAHAQDSMRALGGGGGAAEDQAAPIAPGFVANLLADVREIQRDLQTRLAESVAAIKDQTSPWPLLVLIGLSFAYGIFHAAGPGHGKIVISAYLLAGEENLRRGVLLAVLAALLQAASAIALVGVLALVLGVSNLATADRVGTLEAASYGVVALLGMWMLWRVLREAWAHRAGNNHHHHHDHGHGELARVAGASWREAALVVLAVGIRPCSGAVIVLLFALTQGLLAAGVLAALAMSVGTAITVSVLAGLSVALRRGALTLTSTSNRWQTIAANTLGIAGAAVVTLFGVTFFAAAL